MAAIEYMTYGDQEIANVLRTYRRSEAMGLGVVRLKPGTQQWLGDALGASGFGRGSYGHGPFGGSYENYDDAELTPWFDELNDASREFAGFVPLSVMGLDDSSYTAEVTDYITDGGRVNMARNETLPIVFDMVIVASSDRGAQYGKAYLDRMLARRTESYNSSTLRYFRNSGSLTVPSYQEQATKPPVMHRNKVRLTRGTSVTRKTVRRCSVTWRVTFTMTAGDSYEYGDRQDWVSGLGGTPHLADGSIPVSGSYGTRILTETGCPSPDYSPIYDPRYPALVAPPTVPDFLPPGWGIVAGKQFQRSWVKLDPPHPDTLNVVPFVKLTTTTDARYVRVSVWDVGTNTDSQCGPLWTSIVSYLPSFLPMYLDGEVQTGYCWDGTSEAVRRTDSLLYGTDATPVEWTGFRPLSGPGPLMVTLDLFARSAADGGGYEGGGTIRADVKFVPKSD